MSLENRYKVTYDLKKNLITSIRFKQGDIESSVIEVILVDNGLAVNVTGETIEFRFLKPDKTVVYQDSTSGVTIIDAVNGKVDCVLKSNTLAAPGLVKCEIHRSKDGKELTTPSFYFTVESSIGEDGILSTNYISLIENKITGWQSEIDTMKTEYESFKGAQLAADKVTYFQNEINKTNEQLKDKAKSIGVSIVDYPRLTGETHDMPRFQRAINYIKSIGGGRLVVPNTGMDYVFTANNPTIYNPTRVLIDCDNVEIIGIGKPTIKMEGVDYNYLYSQDDLASSGRDWFTAFSFYGVKNCKISGVKFKGTYTGDEAFRYQSPRAKATSFTGCIDCYAEDLFGEDILGNLVNATPGGNWTGEPEPTWTGDTWTRNINIQNCHAVHCLENGFNFMGNTWDCSISGCSAKRCANGVESASVGFTATNNVFNANKSSGLAVSGDNSTVIGNVCCDSANGSGIYIGGGKNIIVSGNVCNNNYQYGIYVFPGREEISILNNILNDNAKEALYKVSLYMVGTVALITKKVFISGNKVKGTGAVYFINANYCEDLIVTNNIVTLETATASIILGANVKGANIKYNTMNKGVTIPHGTGYAFDNGVFNNNSELSTIPTAGVWKLGDIIKVTYPSLQTDYVKYGWICTRAGEANGNAWATSTAYSAGQKVYANNKVYECTVAGTSGTTAPGHSTGTAIDGTVTWQFININATFRELKMMLGI